MKQLKDGDIDEITAKINTRPRKKLYFSTPIEEFFQLLVVNLHLLMESALNSQSFNKN